MRSASSSTLGESCVPASSSSATCVGELHVSPIAELNTPAAESDPALSPDFRYIVFSSDRSGTMQLYEASR